MAQRRRSGAIREDSPTAALMNIERIEPSEEAKAHIPSDVDAMGEDKRREVVGHSYGPSRRSQIMFFITVAAALVVVVGGWLTLVALFDKPPTHFTDQAPWSKPAGTAALQAEQNVPPRSPGNPCGEPGNAYPAPSGSPCAPGAGSQQPPATGGAAPKGSASQ